MKEHASNGPTAIRALLLALLMAASTTAITATAQGDGVLYETTDPAGDVELQAEGQGAGLPAQATQSTDLVALRIIDENAETLMIEVQVDDMRGPSAYMDGYRDPALYIRFRVDGASAYYHLYAFGISGRGFSTLPNDQHWPLSATLCISNEALRPFPEFTFDVYQGCHYQSVPAITFPADDVVQILVPKLALLGVGGDGDARPNGIPKTIEAGQRLVDWRVESQKRAETTGPFFSITGTRTAYYQDQLPDDGVGDPYTLRAPAANAKVSLRAQGSHGGVFTGADAGITWNDLYPVTYVGVAPEQTAVVPLDVHNGADAKRLVNLTAEFPASGAGRFDVRIAPVIEVPAGETRQVNMVLNVTDPLTHREMIDLEVRGTSLGQDGEIGSALVRLVGNQPPTADRNVLHFHAIQDYGDEPRTGPGPICLLGCSFRFASWLNTLDDDPLDEVGDQGMRGAFYFSTLNTLFGSNVVFVQFFGLDAPLAKDVHFDPDRPIDATLAFSAGADVDATVSMYVSGTILADECPPDERCAENVFLGQGSQAVTIGTEPTPVQLSFLPPPDLDVLASAGGSFQVEIVIESDDPRAAAHGYADGFDLLFHPGPSSVSLPVVADPDPAPTGGLFVSLDAAGETEEFVNPGKTRAFHVLAVNEGVAESAIRIEAAPDAPAWEASVQPGADYRLEPGQSVNVTILVAAPTNAAEGEASVIEVVAHDRNGDASSLPVTLKAIATNGIDIEDQAGEVEADEDTKARLDIDDGGDSPGIGASLTLAALIAVLIIVRRRGGR